MCRSPWALAALLALGCQLDNPGVTPPAGELNFPIAAVLDAAGEFLFVVSSNFDLRYNAGGLVALDLDEVAAGLEDCADEERCVVEVADVVPPHGAVRVGSHASDLALSPDGARLYVSVRAERNLTYVDWDPAAGLDCGGDGPVPDCDDAHQRGDEPASNDRGLRIPADPVGLVARPLAELAGDADLSGDAVLMAHRGGQVSVFLDRADGTGRAPLLVDTLEGLPAGLTGLRFQGDSPVAWVPSTDAASIERVGLVVDGPSGDLVRSRLFRWSGLRVRGVAGGDDVRELRFDPRPGVDRVYVLSRAPESVWLVDVPEPGSTELRVHDLVEIGAGPSRLELGRFASGPGERVLLFASAFDARAVYIVDADLGRLVGVVRGLSGPFDLAVDVARERLYVADFRASVVRVVSLTPVLDCLAAGAAGASCEPIVLGSVGTPRPVGELQ